MTCDGYDGVFVFLKHLWNSPLFSSDQDVVRHVLVKKGWQPHKFGDGVVHATSSFRSGAPVIFDLVKDIGHAGIVHISSRDQVFQFAAMCVSECNGSFWGCLVFSAGCVYYWRWSRVVRLLRISNIILGVHVLFHRADCECVLFSSVGHRSLPSASCVT